MKGAAPAVVAVMLIVAAGACGQSAGRTDLQKGPPCSLGTVLQSGTVTNQITVDGRQRTYTLTSPGGDTGLLRGVVFDFPGLGESAKEEAAYSHLAQEAAARGFFGVTAQAANNIWTIPPLPGPNDFHYFQAVLADIEAQYCVSPAAIFVAGISNGAAFAGALACQPGVFVRGVAMVAGINAYAQCQNDPVRVIGFNGTADPIIPYNGGKIFGGADQQGGGIVPPADQAFRGWGSRNLCFGSPTTTDVASDVQLSTFAQCSAKTELYTLVGGGHTWPGAAPVAGKLLGPTNTSVSATQLILDFFAS